ncbi:MAG: DUF1553 domain-containing protein [Armatimonadetes bacterium]|nr:DUF1553 domain-containing protein [Armatimonadota bacterium]
MQRSRNGWALVALGLLAAPLGAAEKPSLPAVVRPYETDFWSVLPNAVDLAMQATLDEKVIRSAKPCSDEVFVRRVHLDVIGTLPDPDQVVAFLRDRRPEKRAELIEQLLARPEFADYWAMRWSDVLRVKAEFPINLWPNAVQAYHRWLLDAMWQNMPYDQFARELLTASGSNFRVPQVNFYRAVQNRDPSGLAEAVALTFMGTRLATWPEERRQGLAAFFSRLATKSTAEWKEEIVYLNPEPTEPLAVVFPDGAKAVIPAGTDPRQSFAAWLISPKNPWFARNVVNRLWSWLMGRGIIHEADDIRPDNPPVNPRLLACLEQELIAANWDLRAVYRLILNSRTYQQSSIPRSSKPEAEANFAHYAVRRLDAEVLADALLWLTGEGDTFSSPIPEPFTHIPKDQRTTTLADGSITSPFLEMFGRPPRDTGLESERSNQPSDAQRLYLLNSSDMQRRLEKSPRLKALNTASKGNRRTLIASLYLTILSRPPSAEELAVAEAYYATPNINASQAGIDLAWALINTKEFSYRH